MNIDNLKHFDVGDDVPDFEIQRVPDFNVYLLLIREKQLTSNCKCSVRNLLLVYKYIN